MHSKKNDIMKYAGAAMAVGGAVMLGSGLAGGSSAKTKRKIKKTANKAIDAFDVMVNNMHNMMK